MAIESQLQVVTSPWVYGVRSVNKTVIYPLSVGQQLKLTDIILTCFQDFDKISVPTVKHPDPADNSAQLVEFVFKAIQDNISHIINLVVDEAPSDILENVTNDQLIALIDLIYSMNYEKSIKNLKGLFQKMRGVGATLKK